MKKLKMIVAAIAMICLSTAATITGTVAWFAANRTVTVTGMHIKAKSDADYLEISTNGTSGWNTAVDIAVDAEILPVAHKDFSSKADITAADYTGNTTRWYYNYSDSESTSTPAFDDIYLTDFDTKVKNKYVIVNDFYFRVKNSTDNVASELKVDSVTFTPTSTGNVNTVQTVFAGNDGIDELPKTGTANVLINTVDYVADGIMSTYQVTTYTYVDGDHNDVKTDNILKLDGTIEIKFTSIPRAR